MEIKKKFHVIFLILHFRDIALTAQSVNDVLKIAGQSKIVIVDNSPGNDKKILYQKLGEMKDIDIVVAKDNLGFSGGNNLGYEFIRNKYDFDFLVAMNNDVFIKQSDFIEQIDCLYKETDFAVAGPDVYVPQRYYHSSPMRIKPYDVAKIEESNQLCYAELAELSKIFSLKEYVKYIKKCKNDSIWAKALFALARGIKGQIRDYNNYKENCVLQGACFIFSCNYFRKMDYLFKPLTYLYLEEDILTRECIAQGLKIVYCPKIKVDHLCEGSSQLHCLSYSQYCNSRKKMIRLQLEANDIYSKEYL